MYAISNCKIYTGTRSLLNKAIIVEDDRIVNLVDSANLPVGISIVNLEGLSVAPGFIDIQVNGGGGFLFNQDPAVATIGEIHRAHKRFGTTNFLPVLLSDAKEKTAAAVKAVQYCLDKGLYGVLGLHLEGPFINPRKAGIHNKKYIRELQAVELAELLKAAGAKVLKLMTVAPEVIRPEHLTMLWKTGVRLSAGHSDITYDEAIKCFKNGITCITHLFNAMSQFGSREPGLTGAALQAENVWTGVIADGYHVHYAAIDIAKRIKRKKLFLVTDAMPPVGTNCDYFTLGDYLIHCEEGKCVTNDGTLAGTTLDMAAAVRNCVYEIGIPVEEALRMASTYVAEFLGMEFELGRIKPNYQANMVIFDDRLTIKGVVANGELEYLPKL